MNRTGDNPNQVLEQEATSKEILVRMSNAKVTAYLTEEHFLDKKKVFHSVVHSFIFEVEKKRVELFLLPM